MSCDNTTLYVYVSTLSGTASETIVYDSLSGSIGGTIPVETLTTTISTMAGSGTGNLQSATVSATTPAVSATIVGTLNDVVRTVSVKPSTGTVSGNFSVVQNYADLYDFTGVITASAEEIPGNLISLTNLTLTGGTVNGNNYNIGETVSSTVTAGTLSSPSVSSIALASALADEYIEGIISSDLYIAKNAYGTVTKLAGDSTITVTITSIEAPGTAVVEDHPYDVYSLASISVTGGDFTSTLSGFSTTVSVTGGTLSSETTEAVLTGFGLNNHAVVGELQTSLGTFPASATITKDGGVYTGSTSNVENTLDIDVSLRSLSSISVNGLYGVNPGSAFAEISGATLMEVISSGSISSTTTTALLTSETSTHHLITGTINTYETLYQAPVSGYITTALDGTYTGVLTSITGNMDTTTIGVYQLSSIPLTSGNITGSLSSETLSINLTSGTVSSNLDIPYILTDDSVTSLPVTGILNDSIDITGYVSTTGNDCSITIDTVNDQLIDIPTYSLSSISITGGAVTETQSNSAWVDSYSTTVNVTGGSLSTSQTHILTSESISSIVTTGTLGTDAGDLTASLTLSTSNNIFTGVTDGVGSTSEVETIVPVSSFDTQFIIETETISSGDVSTTTLTADLSSAEPLNSATVIGYISPTVDISGTIGTTPVSLSAALDGDDFAGNFYTLYGGGMAGGAGTEHSMTNIPITGGTLSGTHGCMSITRTLTAGQLSSDSITTLALSATLTAHNVTGYAVTDEGENIDITGNITKSVSGNNLWTGVLSSTGGSTNVSELVYDLSPLSTTTGVITGSLSGESVSADITSSLLSSQTLTYLLTCDNALSSHALTGTVTTGTGTALASGTITTTASTYTGTITIDQYPVAIPAYSLLTIPVTGAEWKTSSSSYSLISGFTGITGTLSSTSQTYMLTSENVTGHNVEGVLENAEFGSFDVSGTVDTASGNYTVQLSGNPLSSETLTATTISSFPRKELNIGRGYTYTFILTTPWPNFEEFKLSTTQDGENNNGVAYTDNVKGVGANAPGDELKLTVTHNTPSTLYYYSTLTQDAGDVINITNACSISDDGSYVTDSSTTGISDKQIISSKRPKVKFIFNNQDLTQLKLYNDTKYTFFVNNSTNGTFSFNNESGGDASLGSPRQISNNRSREGVISFARQSNRSIIGIGNQGETGEGEVFTGEIYGGPSFETAAAPPPSETGYTEPTNITAPPGATSPNYSKVSVDCEASELFRHIPGNTKWRMPLYTRTYTNVYSYVQNRTWEYPEWTFIGALTSIRTGSSVAITTIVDERDPIKTTGTGSLSEDTFTYNWEGVASSTDTLTGTGIVTMGFDQSGGESGAAYGTWDTRFNDIPSVSGTDSWDLQDSTNTTTFLSTVIVEPTPGDYKARVDYPLHDIFTSEYSPVVVSHGVQYNHWREITIGPLDNDVTIFTASELWTNGGLYFEKNGNGIYFPIDSTADSVGNVVGKDTIIDVVKAGETTTILLSGTDGENIWAMGMLSYIETVCFNAFELKNIEVDEYQYDPTGEYILGPTFNNDTTFDANTPSNLSAVSGSELALTLTHIPDELSDAQYRWFKTIDDTPIEIPGAVAATLNIPRFTFDDNGDYSVSIETLYKYKQSQTVSITAFTFTPALAAIYYEYDSITTYGLVAGTGHLWTTPELNVQVWRCVHTEDNTLSAVQAVANKTLSITPYNDGGAEVMTSLTAATPTFLGGSTSEVSAISSDPLNWHFAGGNTNGQLINGLSLSGMPDTRFTNEIGHNEIVHTWNGASDAPIITGGDSIFVLFLSTPLTGQYPMYPVLDGGPASIVPGDETEYTHFISQTGYKTDTLTATDLSSLQFTADTLTGSPAGRTFDYVFDYQPWSHHLAVSSLGLSGSTANIKIQGLSGFNSSGSFYENGATVSATFLSLKSMSTYTYLSSTSTYAVTGDVVYPDTNFHVSTRPGLVGKFDIDVHENVAFDSSINDYTIYELLPYGTNADNTWNVSRKVATLAGVEWTSGDYGTASIDSVSTINHPFAGHLSANNTDKVRYLLVYEYDSVPGPYEAQTNTIEDLTILTYDNDGVVNGTYYSEAGEGEDLPTWYFNTTTLSATSGWSEDSNQGTMTITNLPVNAARFGSDTDTTYCAFGLSSAWNSTEGSTESLTGVNTMGEIHLNISSVQTMTD